MEFTDAPACKSVVDKSRQSYCQLISSADAAIESLSRTVKELFNNSDHEFLLIVFGDNGADVSQGGSNAPLRGAKGGLYEGGVRNNAIMHSTAFPASHSGMVYHGLVHLVDIHALILGFAGASLLNDGHLQHHHHHHPQHSNHCPQTTPLPYIRVG